LSAAEAPAAGKLPYNRPRTQGI